MVLSALESSFVDGVNEVLAAFGNIEHTFFTQDSGTFDPVAGTVSDPVSVGSVVGSPPIDYTVREIESGLAQSGEKRIITKGSGFVTFDPDLVVLIVDASGNKWRVLDVTYHSTGTNIAAYEWRVVK